MKPRGLSVRIAVASAAAMWTLAGAAKEDEQEPDPLCSALEEFVEGTPHEGSQSVRIMTDWSDRPTIACLRDDSQTAARRLCRLLPKRLSIEFMSANVLRAQRCLGMKVGEPSDFSMAGTDTIRREVSKQRSVTIRITYDTERRGDTLPFLEITSIAVR